ncbi:uncharacterized protein si:ch211-269k10.4 [Coregonus clupeaformis]|uniref:uncharacterized protein si:ch211-269k10.4 n=1 Tax=Coregonus clupeaformis TaxID=59861 RepID=UPI001BE06DF5|nr:uncharacterized protein si:ch211-269k10.4 [Coregonus clupeaformis]
MACADIPMDILGPEAEAEAEAEAEEQEYEEAGDQRGEALIKYYQAAELMPAPKGPLHDLLLKQPAVLGSLQMMCGLLSVAVGVVFAATREASLSLLTMFRVAPFTGLLFFIAGLLSNLLFKFPRLLPVCLCVNIGCMVVAVVGGLLICVDLAITSWNPNVDHHLKLEMLMLCVLVLEVTLSAVLSFWIRGMKRSHSL